MDEFKVLAPAKVNIALDVVGRRPDGYHLMKMINHSTNLADRLAFKYSEDLSLTCDHPDVPLGESNLILKAARKLKNCYQVEQGARIHLEKRIPMQAGLAGGSADAAAAIKGLNELWNLKMSMKEMQDFGVTIGADVPYCLVGGTALVEGIGEIITPLKPLPDCILVIAKPPVDISTPWAFNQVDTAETEFHPPIDHLIDLFEEDAVDEALKWVGNSFEPVVFSVYPEIENLKDQMKQLGAELSIMSGSGSTIVGYFNDIKRAENAADILNNKNISAFLARIG